MDTFGARNIEESRRKKAERTEIDGEKRELVRLGNAQRHFTQQSESSRAFWHWHFAEAAERYKASPKWATVGKAMSAESDRLWLYAEVDTLVIALRPLVNAYNRTYRDHLNVIRKSRSPLRSSAHAPRSSPQTSMS